MRIVRINQNAIFYDKEAINSPTKSTKFVCCNCLSTTANHRYSHLLFLLDYCRPSLEQLCGICDIHGDYDFKFCTCMLINQNCIQASWRLYYHNYISSFIFNKKPFQFCCIFWSSKHFATTEMKDQQHFNVPSIDKKKKN